MKIGFLKHVIFYRGYDTIDGRHPFGVVFPIFKGGNPAFIAATAGGLFPENEYRSLE